MLKRSYTCNFILRVYAHFWGFVTLEGFTILLHISCFLKLINIFHTIQNILSNNIINILSINIFCLGTQVIKTII